MNNAKTMYRIISLLEMEEDHLLLLHISKRLCKKNTTSKNGAPFPCSTRKHVGCAAVFLFSMIGFILGIWIWFSQFEERFWLGILQGAAVHLLLSVGGLLILYAHFCHTEKAAAGERESETVLKRLKEKQRDLSRYYTVMGIPAGYQNIIAMQYLRDASQARNPDSLPALLTLIQDQMKRDGIWDMAQELTHTREDPEQFLHTLQRILQQSKKQKLILIRRIPPKARSMIRRSELRDFYESQDAKKLRYAVELSALEERTLQ